MLRTAGEMLKTEMAKRGMKVEVQIESRNKEPDMASEEKRVLKDIEASRAAYTDKCDAYDRTVEAKKLAKEEKEAALEHLLGLTKELPLLAGEEPNDAD